MYEKFEYFNYNISQNVYLAVCGIQVKMLHSGLIDTSLFALVYFLKHMLGNYRNWKFKVTGRKLSGY